MFTDNMNIIEINFNFVIIFLDYFTTVDTYFVLSGLISRVKSFQKIKKSLKLNDFENSDIESDIQDMTILMHFLEVEK